jgi:hypothetical protein
MTRDHYSIIRVDAKRVNADCRNINPNEIKIEFLDMGGAYIDGIGLVCVLNTYSQYDLTQV